MNDVFTKAIPVDHDDPLKVKKVMEKMQELKQGNRLLSSRSIQSGQGEQDDDFVEDPEIEFKMRSKDLDYVQIVKKDKLEKIYTKKDRWPCLPCRKFVLASRVKFVMFIYGIISHKYFDGISLMVIIANSLSMTLEDPTAKT